MGLDARLRILNYGGDGVRRVLVGRDGRWLGILVLVLGVLVCGVDGSMSVQLTTLAAERRR